MASKDSENSTGGASGETPLVSVCIPLYNKAAKIERTLECVAAQTYRNLEIVVSDNASTDGSGDIVRRFAQRDERVKYFRLESTIDIYQSWRYALLLGRGEICKLQGADDELDPRFIETMVRPLLADRAIEFTVCRTEPLVDMPLGGLDPGFFAPHYAEVAKFVGELTGVGDRAQRARMLLTRTAVTNMLGDQFPVVCRRSCLPLEHWNKARSNFPVWVSYVDWDFLVRLFLNHRGFFVEETVVHFSVDALARRATEARMWFGGDVGQFMMVFDVLTDSTLAPLRDQATADEIKLLRQVAQQQLEQLFGLADEVQAFASDASTARVLPRLGQYVEAFGKGVGGAETRLRPLRKQLADYWLSAPAEQMQRDYQSDRGKAQAVLMGCGLRECNGTETQAELEFAEGLATELGSASGVDAVRTLLAAMLYCWPQQLPQKFDLTALPDWLVEDYLKFMFDPPMLFHEMGDAEGHHQFLRHWVGYLHERIFAEPDSPRWRWVAMQFLQRANYIRAYFNDANLKDIYVQRAQIMEHALKSSGLTVDWEFGPRRPGGALRLGVLAMHYNPSAETAGILSLFENAQKDMEVTLYALGATGHASEQYCRSRAHAFRVLPAALADQAHIIRADDLDILFVVTNVTAVTHQICLLALHRLARTQVTSIGSVTTTGMRTMDYYISGTLTDPWPDAQEHYSEKLVKIDGPAHCFSYGAEPQQASLQVSRAMYGISPQTLVFMSRANLFKIIPELIDLWARVVAAVPGSMLILDPFGPNWAANYPKSAFADLVMRGFARRGMGRERFMVWESAPSLTRRDIHELLKMADIYLHSYPFSGTTSLIEPLEMGLPVVERRGRTFRSTEGSALLQELGLDSLIADTDEEYIRIAVKLATDRELREKYRRQILERMAAGPRFLNSRSYAERIGPLLKRIAAERA